MPSQLGVGSDRWDFQLLRVEEYVTRKWDVIRKGRLWTNLFIMFFRRKVENNQRRLNEQKDEEEKIG